MVAEAKASLGGSRGRCLLIAVALAFLAATRASADPTLIGHWGFEEGSGSTALDSSANGLNGTIHDATYVQGKVGAYALRFDGVNDYVDVSRNLPNFSLLTPTNISISMWFKPATTQNDPADLLDQGHGGSSSPYYGGYVFQYAYSGQIQVIYGDGRSFREADTGASYKDGVWHHIVANLGPAGVAVYMDGTLSGSAAGGGPMTANDQDLYFGRHANLGRYFTGLIDDIQIYSGPLTESEVTQLYLTGTLVPEPFSMAFLGSAFVGVVAFRLRRRKKAS